MSAYDAIAGLYDPWSRSVVEDIGFYVNEARAARGPVVELGVGTGRVAVPTAEAVAPALMAELSTLGHPPRVIAVFRREGLREGVEAPVGLALWRVADPGNVGTLVRAADALGPAFVALSPGCADPTGPKALRASAGAIFRVPFARFDEAPRPRIALLPEGGEAISDVALGERATFVLGAEREGLPAEVRAETDAAATIPIAAGADSLNVAVAGAIALYEFGRRATQTMSSPPS